MNDVKSSATGATAPLVPEGSPVQPLALEALRTVLADMGPRAIAVSGGVDSMTLATVAARQAPERTWIFHAVSAAVPAEATQRVRSLAASEHWQLQLIDAGELRRADYVANPVNRCLHCKQSLYAAIGQHTPHQVLSGANLDDLGDYRPGLQAAADAGVRHPLVEARIDKATVRAIARQLGLGLLSELPASPCLSSRVQTGIAISAPMLLGIDAAEQLVRKALRARDVRCRVRREGVVVELDEDALAALGEPTREELGHRVSQAIGAARSIPLAPARFEPYRVGSAFLRTPA